MAPAELMLPEAVLCMALSVFHEARGEPYYGRVAVALVVRNRAEKNGTSVCWETFRDAQFSWTNDAKNLRTLPSGDKWDEAQVIARTVLGGAPDFTNGATHYHTIGSSPRWRNDLRKIGTWGSHVFYKERGTTCKC